MVWELHVWGPAFSLPSIDAQCLAAIAYFTQAVPKGQWLLVASSDPTLSPTKDLPALRDGATWIGGFRNVLDYVRQYSHRQWDLDRDLPPQEKADCIAFSSFVEAHGQPLLDLSLYVSSQNYASATRPAYAPILPWPSQWITPPNRRAAARARTRHLGLSSLDVDTTPDPAARKSTTATSGADQIPASLLRRPRETVTSLLAEPQHRYNTRLHTLTKGFLQPLQDLLGKKKFFFADDRPSSLDCLVVGYLALALFPDLPQPWLADEIGTGFGRLGGYVHNLVGPFFGGAVSVEQALAGGAGATERDQTEAEAEAEAESHQRSHQKGALPWKAPERGGLLAIGSLVLENVMDSIPLVDQLRASNRLSRAANESNYMTEEEKKQVQAIATARRRELFSQVFTVGAGVSAFVGYLFYNGIISLSAGEEEEAGDTRSLADMGEAGAMLAMANYTDRAAAEG